jgi:hypothetical protein
LRRDGARRIVFGLVLGWCVGLVQPWGLAQTRRAAKPAAPVVDSPYAITGVVINSVGGDPVAHCHLTANLIGRAGSGNRQFPAPANGFDCDSRGRFTVTVPSAGSWHLSASARGFVSQALDEHQGGYSSAIVLTADAPTKEIEFRLSPEATIAGVVLDEAGEPVRNAQVTLQNVPPPTPGGLQPAGNIRGGARTDDRGMYELANLAPGEYRLMVHAQPWYTANLQQGVRGNDTEAASSDPSLDFAYPVTWFPGVSDAAMAETIVLRAGDTRQADFHLVPIPSIHMRIVTPPRANNGPNGAPIPMAFPIVQQISSGGGGPSFVQITTHFDQQGQIDVGGLTPGLYQVRLAGPNQEGRTAMVEVTANSVRTLDMTAPSRDLARITVHLDGLAGMDADSDSRPGRNGGVQVTLIDTDTHRGSFSANGNEGGPGRRDARDPDADRVMEVPPGRYEVVLQGRQNIFLTGLAAKGAETAGRYVTVGAGDSTLTVHVASGRASLSGVATMDGKPVVGAMILLVPITIEDRNSITMLRQDQTNTDGSYDLANIIPGQYILVAIDHGWQINWGDASTLRRYLMQGVPVDLKSSAIVKQNITAVAP